MSIAGRRTGPHPLPFYLAVARAAAQGGALPGGRLADFLTGLKAYWTHPQVRPKPGGTELARLGTTRLVDFGGAGPPVLLVPSLINRAYILDLHPERSLARALAGSARVTLLDWRSPDALDLASGIEHYVIGRLERAVRTLRRRTGMRPVLVGYCMGGLLALAAAVRRPRDLAGLALLATPWDFSRSEPVRPALPAIGEQALAALVARFGHVPRSFVEAAFATVEPAQVIAKFAAFGRMEPTSLQARVFVAVEDWLADGTALAGPLARHCLEAWYIQNLPGRGRWTVGGRPVRPDRLAMPVLVAAPRHDRIVPESSALAVAERLPDVTMLRPPSGHVGMVVGERAREILWEPLAQWLRRIAGRA